MTGGLSARSVAAAIRSVVEGRSLSREDAAAVMGAIMDGDATPAQIGALLAGLRAKRETTDEIVGFARAMRARSVRVECERSPLLDTCGTGGDAAGTLNISTGAAFVVAAAGLAVAKHGNRAASGACGSADVLEALGVRLDLSPCDVGRCIDLVGIGFLYAPSHHPAMRHAAQPRREIGIRTVFNVLGPLTNPAGASLQVIGVFDRSLCATLAEALADLGAERAMVVHGMDGLDEVSTIGPTCVSHLRHGAVETTTITPDDLGLPAATREDLRSGRTPAESAALLRAVLEGERGPRRDVIAANAAAGLIVGDGARTWMDAVRRASDVLDTGAAARVLDRLIAFTKGCKDERPL
ncbi:MAG TPA: anthranilate phosphoribosyltransferase [Chthonomonadales bacterium]|nr:anthranilate phosphoribosyltransferase [Chthonomonadales bacterium]